METSNKNLLALEGLELEELEDSNSFQSSNAHHCLYVSFAKIKKSERSLISNNAFSDEDTHRLGNIIVINLRATRNVVMQGIVIVYLILF